MDIAGLRGARRQRQRLRLIGNKYERVNPDIAARFNLERQKQKLDDRYNEEHEAAQAARARDMAAAELRARKRRMAAQEKSRERRAKSKRKYDKRLAKERNRSEKLKRQNEKQKRKEQKKRTKIANRDFRKGADLAWERRIQRAPASVNKSTSGQNLEKLYFQPSAEKEKENEKEKEARSQKLLKKALGSNVNSSSPVSIPSKCNGLTGEALKNCIKRHEPKKDIFASSPKDIFASSPNSQSTKSNKSPPSVLKSNTSEDVSTSNISLDVLRAAGELPKTKPSPPVAAAKPHRPIGRAPPYRPISQTPGLPSTRNTKRRIGRKGKR